MAGLGGLGDAHRRLVAVPRVRGLRARPEPVFPAPPVTVDERLALYGGGGDPLILRWSAAGTVHDALGWRVDRGGCADDRDTFAWKLVAIGAGSMGFVWRPDPAASVQDTAVAWIVTIEPEGTR